MAVSPSTRPPRCRGWQQEAALSMLENNLHPDVAENPAELIVYGGIGKAARDHTSYATIRRELMRLGDDETLLVQSGKPVAVFETHEYAPRVLIANTNLVPDWATWEEFRKLDAAGLIMYGQMTAGSWIYIGSQGILQGTYETFAAAARKRFGGSLRGRLVVTAGLGGMGGAQPLAITMCGGTALCVEVDLRHIERRLETGYLDERAADLDDALTRLEHRGPRGPRVVDRAARQRGRRAARTGSPGRAGRRGDRSDLGPRPPQRLCPLRPDRRAGRGAAADRPRRLPQAGGRSVLGHVAAIRGLPAGCRGVRLRQRVARPGRRARRRAGLLLSRVRSGIHQATVL